MADAIVPLGGWGYGNWGSGEWDTNSPALPLGTTQLGTATVAAGATVSVTGVSGSSALGTAGAVIAATVNVTGVSATLLRQSLSLELLVFSLVAQHLLLELLEHQL